MKDVTELLAINLKRMRKKRELSQEELAERADISHTSIAFLETQKKWASSQMIKKLCAGLDIEPHELFIDPDKKIRPEPLEIITIVSEALQKSYESQSMPLEMMSLWSKTPEQSRRLIMNTLRGLADGKNKRKAKKA